MQSDFEDTVIAPATTKDARRPESAEPDFEATALRPANALTQRAPAVDPHVWPAETGANEPAAAAAPPAARAYGFRVSGSEIVMLDRVVYLGRKPSVPRVVRGGMPRLVRVPSPTQEVSATHLELRQVGSTVVIVDMRSTNGTMVGVPGLPVRRLRQGESLVVTPGTLIDVGDRNVIEILSLQDLS